MVNIIGSGVAGLASAIRLAAAGYKVRVFEQNTGPGGKLSELYLGKYRFDKGPSLFTMPALVDELKDLAGSSKPFTYKKLEVLTHYFYEDGTQLRASAKPAEFAKEVATVLREDEYAILKHLSKSAFFYDTTAKLFLEQSLHRFKSYWNKNTIKGILNASKLQLNKTMHQANSKAFTNPKTIQLFNRYATYNGSNPYKAPALLNIIPHLEYGMGAYLPDNGMFQITQYLYCLAMDLKVEFIFNTPVHKILLEGNKLKGVEAGGKMYESDWVLSDIDIHVLYKQLLPPKFAPQKLLKQEKSSSAYVFYWGIKNQFTQLGLHNILFSENYEEEFRHLFEEDSPYHDPTIYINITSKYCKSDAPEGCENWFVMVNVPHNKSGLQIKYGTTLRSQVIDKINRVLKTDINKWIEQEEVITPLDIEKETSSFGGSLYGNSSNNKYAAFLRHANYHSKIKGLYLAGGSVHPGGGIPLCLLSAKIATGLLIEKDKNRK